MDGYVSQTIPVIVSDGALDWPLLREADLNLDFIAKVCVASTAPKDGNKQNKNKQIYMLPCTVLKRIAIVFMFASI